jgi:ribosomal-protein-alanine N-acetyltransferase
VGEGGDPTRACPTLGTPRLVLRALGLEDLDPYFAAYSHPEAMRHWSCAPLADRTAARAYLEASMDPARMLTWSILRREDEAWLGTATLSGVDLEHRRAELGVLLDPSHWGRGYAKEALGAVLDYGFGSLALHRVEADVDPRNEASLRVLERLGFVREGLLRERWGVGGSRQDGLMLGILAREWAARQDPRSAPTPP